MSSVKWRMPSNRAPVPFFTEAPATPDGRVGPSLQLHASSRTVPSNRTPPTYSCAQARLATQSDVGVDVAIHRMRRPNGERARCRGIGHTYSLIQAAGYAPPKVAPQRQCAALRQIPPPICQSEPTTRTTKPCAMPYKFLGGTGADERTSWPTGTITFRRVTQALQCKVACKM